MEEDKVIHFKDLFSCPCCGYPMLTEKSAYEICSLCFWEDDGQDDLNADRVLGGPNSDYSLTEARENFRKYYTMYRPSDSAKFEMTTVKKDFEGGIILDKVQLKKEIITKYQIMLKEHDTINQTKLWNEIVDLERQLL